jgi:Ca2+:H+ antiporter
MNIDSIKSRARHHGWTQDGELPWDKFNPFARKVRRTRTTDSERDIGFTGPPIDDSPVDEKPEQHQTPTTGEAAAYYEGGDVENAPGNGAIRQRKDSGDDVDDVESPEIAVDTLDNEEEKKRRRDELLKKKIPPMQQLRSVLFPHWFTINWLLFAAPVGIALNYVHINPLAVFLVNFIAIIPLAGILSFATEEIALRVGEVLGGLLNASFGLVFIHHCNPHF